MTIRLYLETNFLLSHATGRDSATDRLIGETFADLRIAMPSCCIMEALTMSEGERKRITRQIQENETLIKGCQRHSASPHALNLVDLLIRSNGQWKQGYDFFSDRLSETIQWLSEPERVELLATRSNGLSLFSRMIHEIEPTDQLILATILEDVQEHPSQDKVFLTENHRCFHDNLTVRRSLQGAGIRKYFPSATIFLKWYDAGAEF